ncbi:MULTISPECIES: TetR/AcrR family transcriptional regulator [unclassified Dietzia]|uniref:TetR/AcrR family transcriptional regulator n=1 Tax=unclassified Dietzia TaxID=2617939 RepID=UPI000D226BCF|nr:MULTISPECIES: TetR/AcrR family transcriptional regulator [unclassified Dietzia]AVZ38827.1 TetR family transcriptional regulator [Dietzia sp. JS16-p6b]QGW23944.1 TetR family transcriptional regulator [Dietzia sp. DQ12-45-1b]
MTTPGSRAEQKRHTRALIVAAGRNAVATRGFSGLGVREIAREAGIVPTAFYRHFESVDALATEIAAGAAEALGGLVDALVAEPASDPAVDWPERASALAVREPQNWSVLARGLVDTTHADHRVLSAAVDAARRRVGIALGRLETLSGADGNAVDVAADLVVVVLLRLVVEVAVGHDARAAADECTGRLRIILAGAGTVSG